MDTISGEAIKKPDAIRENLINETLASWSYTRIRHAGSRVSGYVEIDNGRVIEVVYCEKQLAAYLVGVAKSARGCHKKCGECPT